MQSSFQQHLHNQFPFLADSKLLVACSGGLDSVVLLQLCQAANLEVSVAHCNFQLRGKESDGDALFVEALAKELLKCKNNEAVKHLGIEWGIQQSKELKAQNVPGIHYYTMSNSDEVKAIASEVF